MANEVNPDLSKERSTAGFDVEEFAVWWADGEEKLNKRRALQRIFFEDPEFDDATSVNYLSHVELYEYGIQKAIKFVRKIQKVLKSAEPIVIDEEMLYSFRMTFTSGLIGSALFPMGFPFRLHYSMFMQTILRQGTEEQRREWLPKCWRCEMIGTYAQSELGHGTYIRGLETRADYDAKTEEFVLNTPTLSSYKWWPGQMGQTTNFVILMAQLYIGGKKHGVHPFLLQIRDFEAHMPMPGVEVGEIGPKMALNGFNNGYLALNNVRIPRLHMLMKNATVAPDGTFKRHGDLTLVYSSMVFMRAMIVRDASFSITQAATIATRYSAVRRQSPIELNEPEPQILDHVTQQLKLFPQIAKAVVFKLAADHVWEMYREVMDGADPTAGLSELHALVCCLKAVCTADAVVSVEVLRLACGGQGFLASSNLPNIYGSAAPGCTYEGENTVVLLQTARFLMKAWKLVLSGKQLPSTVSYLSNYNQPVKWFKSLDRAIQALQATAANKIRQTYDYMQKKIEQGCSQQAAANFSGIRLTQAATLHTRAYLASSAYEQIRNQTKKLSPALGKVLWNLLEMFLLDTILSNLGDVLNCVCISAEEVAAIQLRLEVLLSWMRPNAVALVDGFDLHDRILNSTLGAYDGRVYERLLEEAKKSPLNQQPVNQSFEKYLKPFMRGKL